MRLHTLIPTNWLDPLLTGPTAVITGYPYSARDIESLLLAIQKRVEVEDTSRRREVELTIKGLLRIAKLAMPDTYFQTDRRVARAHALLTHYKKGEL